MSRALQQDYYVKKRQKILKEFDAFTGIARKVAPSYVDDATITAVVARARCELEKLLPTLPYVGGDDSPFTPLITNSAETLAFYRASGPLKMDPRRMGQFIYEIAEGYAESLPAYKKRLARWLVFSGRMKRRWSQALAESQRHAYPENWEGEFIEGDGKTFDYGFNFTECAWLKLVHKEGGAEIAPYVCLCDYAKMRGVGIGFRRTQTLATGGKLCDFRFVKGGTTPRAWPPEALTEGQAYWKKRKSSDAKTH